MQEALKHSLHRSNLHAHAHGSCPLLDRETHKCSVYDARPAICHLFGAVEVPKLTCPHGRRPEVLLTKSECDKVINDVAKLGHGNDLTYLKEVLDIFAKAEAGYMKEGLKHG